MEKASLDFSPGGIIAVVLHLKSSPWLTSRQNAWITDIYGV